MATHSSTLAWRIPWTEEVVHWVSKSQTWLKQLSTHTCLSCDCLTSFKYYDSSTVWLSFFRFDLHFAILSAEMSLIFLHFHHIQIYTFYFCPQITTGLPSRKVQISDKISKALKITENEVKPLCHSFISLCINPRMKWNITQEDRDKLWPVNHYIINYKFLNLLLLFKC